MGYEIDSGALSLLNRAFNLAGQPSGQTTLLDGDVTQTVDVGKIARRSLPVGGGLWYAAMMCTHTATGDLAVELNPYNAIHATPGGLTSRGFPADVDNSFDLWILSAVATTNDATDFATLALSYAVPAVHFGINILNTAGVVSSPNSSERETPLVHWDSAVSASATVLYATRGDGTLTGKINQRIRRGAVLRLRSTADTAGTLANVCIVTLGLFPVCLGQDVAF